MGLQMVRALLWLIEVFACYLDIDAFMLLQYGHSDQSQTKRLFAISLLRENKPLKNPLFSHTCSHLDA